MLTEIKNWILQAERDLESAKHAFESNDHYVVAFMCHQAVEKSLKALYIKKFKKLRKIHDVAFLAKELGLPEKLIEDCIRLNPVYIDSRYPDVSGALAYYKYKQKNSETFLDIAGKVVKWIKEKI